MEYGSKQWGIEVQTEDKRQEDGKAKDSEDHRISKRMEDGSNEICWSWTRVKIMVTGTNKNGTWHNLLKSILYLRMCWLSCIFKLSIESSVSAVGSIGLNWEQWVWTNADQLSSHSGVSSSPERASSKKSRAILFWLWTISSNSLYLCLVLSKSQ